MFAYTNICQKAQTKGEGCTNRPDIAMYNFGIILMEVLQAMGALSDLVFVRNMLLRLHQNPTSDNWSTLLCFPM
jgi:hypothetical protein